MHDLDTLRDWLILHHAPKLGPRRALKYLRHYGDSSALRRVSAAELKATGLDDATIQFLHHPKEELIARDMLWLQQANHHLLTYNDDAYPTRLREINTSPIVLFAVGEIELLQLPQIAVVGTRHPTIAGLHRTRDFVSALAEYGLVITSGLARGIDTAAHRTALDQTSPTIAVVGTGPDLVYPAHNKNLATRIVENGVILSEFSCGTQAKPQHFPQRNRLISGLSLGVLVVEAAQRSGSLITASFACEQNREVFAIPGSVNNPKVCGCHRLIQQGAKLAQTPEDIIAELIPILDLPTPPQTPPKTAAATPKQDLNSIQHKVLMHMEYDAPTAVDALVAQCNLPVSQISVALSALELKGYICTQNGVYIRLL